MKKLICRCCGRITDLDPWVPAVACSRCSTFSSPEYMVIIVVEEEATKKEKVK